MPAPTPPERQRAYGALAALSERDLQALWSQLDLGWPQSFAQDLTDLLAALIERYGSAAATLAADWYDEARFDAGAAGSFTATPALPPEKGRVAALANWGTAPLYEEAPQVAVAFSKLAGGVQRAVLQMGRDTTEGSVTLDPAKPTFARHASANACAFCRLVATRGPAYTSEAAALRVVGRGTSLETNIGRTSGRKAQGITSRGKRSIGDKYHDWCRCTAIEVWPGQRYMEAPYVTSWRDQYASSLSTSGQYGAIDLKDTLSSWREEFGIR